jgi:hypothetical protein
MTIDCCHQHPARCFSQESFLKNDSTSSERRKRKRGDKKNEKKKVTTNKQNKQKNLTRWVNVKRDLCVERVLHALTSSTFTYHASGSSLSLSLFSFRLIFVRVQISNNCRCYTYMCTIKQIVIKMLFDSSIELSVYDARRSFSSQ